jgi:Spy/CpxP family protein refolding chaperone
MKKIIYALSLSILLPLLISGNLFAQQKQKPKMNFRQNMIEKLNLTDAQKDKISDLRSKNQKEMIDLRADLEKKMIDMKDLKKDPKLTRDGLISAVKDINGIKDQIAIARANHMMDLYEVLTPEQKKIWQENKPMMRDDMRMMFKDGKSCHGRFGRGKFDRSGFGTPHAYDNDDTGQGPDVN